MGKGQRKGPGAEASPVLQTQLSRLYQCAVTFSHKRS